MNPTPALLLIVEGALKGSCFLLAAALLTLSLRRSSAAVRHMIWTTAILAALLALPVSRLMPSWRVSLPGFAAPFARLLVPEPPAATQQTARGAFPSPASMAAVFPATAQATPPPPAQSPSPLVRRAGLPTWMLAVWALGAGTLGLWFLAGSMRLSRTVRTATAIDDDRIVELAEGAARNLNVPRARFRLRWTAEALTPMTWGIRRPFILLPAAGLSWPEERLRQVLLHELAHVKRRDLVTQAGSSLACILYWFNPLVWWAARRMLVERERACDDVVLASGATPSVYAHELLELARSLGAGWTTSRVSTAMARKSQISGRLLAVLDTSHARYAVRRPIAIAAVLLAIALLLPVSALTLASHSLIQVAPGIGALSPAMLSTQTATSAETPAFREVNAAGQKWREALNRGDAQAIAALYTRDAVLVSSGNEPARGRQDIQQYMQFAIRFGAADIEAYQLELHPVGDMVCQIGRVTTRSRTGVELGTSTFMSLWKKEDGEWRIYRDYVTP